MRYPLVRAAGRSGSTKRRGRRLPRQRFARLGNALFGRARRPGSLRGPALQRQSRQRPLGHDQFGLGLRLGFEERLRLWLDERLWLGERLWRRLRLRCGSGSARSSGADAKVCGSGSTRGMNSATEVGKLARPQRGDRALERRCRFLARRHAAQRAPATSGSGAGARSATGLKRGSAPE